LPAELLPFDAEAGGDEDRASFVEEPVRLRFAVAERCQRVEAIEHAMAVEEQQPILRPTHRREEQQRQLIRRQYLLVEQHGGDLPVTLGQMARQLEHPLRTHPHRTRLARRRRRITHRPDHAQRRAFPRLSGNATTLPKAPSVTPAEALPETRARFRAASSNKSASSATASRRCSSLIRAKRGSNSLISVRLPSSRRDRQRSQRRMVCRAARLGRSLHYREATSGLRK
jgi:hypothetical protein